MAHEQSVTQDAPGRRYENVYGPGVVNTPGVTALPGQVLPLQFPYEKLSYPTEPEAVDAAQRRSFDFGNLVEMVMKRYAEAQALQRGQGLDRPIP